MLVGICVVGLWLNSEVVLNSYVRLCSIEVFSWFRVSIWCFVVFLRLFGLLLVRWLSSDGCRCFWRVSLVMLGVCWFEV